MSTRHCCDVSSYGRSYIHSYVCWELDFRENILSSAGHCRSSQDSKKCMADICLPIRIKLAGGIVIPLFPDCTIIQAQESIVSVFYINLNTPFQLRR